MEDLSDKSLKPVIFKASGGYIFLDYLEIIMCCAEGNYTVVYTTLGTNSFKILHKINYISRKYQTDNFIRCHKSYIINLSHLEKLLVTTHQAQLTGGYLAPLSNDCWRKLKDLTEQYM